jgi:hypothetical protein
MIIFYKCINEWIYLVVDDGVCVYANNSLYKSLSLI